MRRRPSRALSWIISLILAILRRKENTTRIIQSLLAEAGDFGSCWGGTSRVILREIVLNFTAGYNNKPVAICAGLHSNKVTTGGRIVTMYGDKNNATPTGIWAYLMLCKACNVIFVMG